MLLPFCEDDQAWILAAIQILFIVGSQEVLSTSNPFHWSYSKESLTIHSETVKVHVDFMSDQMVALNSFCSVAAYDLISGCWSVIHVYLYFLFVHHISTRQNQMVPAILGSRCRIPEDPWILEIVNVSKCWCSPCFYMILLVPCWFLEVPKFPDVAGTGPRRWNAVKNATKNPRYWFQLCWPGSKDWQHLNFDS